MLFPALFHGLASHCMRAFRYVGCPLQSIRIGKQFGGFPAGVKQVFRAISRETDKRVVAEVMVKQHHTPFVQHKVFVHQAPVVSSASRTEHAHKDEGIHTAFHPTPHKDVPAPHLHTRYIIWHHRQFPADFLHEFRKQIFVGIEPQHPLRVYREMVQSPIELCGLVAGIGMYHHLHVREFLADFHGFVGRWGIHHIYFLREGADVLQTSANVQLFVVGQDDGSDVKHNA